MPKFLALQHIFDHMPFTLVEGYYQNPNDASEWIQATNYSVPDGVIVKAGSVVDMNLPQYRQKRAVKNGILADFSEMENYHFNLDAVFGHDMVNHFDNRPATFVDILHEYGIFTLEQIAQEQAGIVPFTPQNTAPSKLPMRAILGTLCGNDKQQIESWIQACKKITAPKEPSKTVEPRKREES